MRAGKLRNAEREWRSTRPQRRFHVKRRPATMNWLEATAAVLGAFWKLLNGR